MPFQLQWISMPNYTQIRSAVPAWFSNKHVWIRFCVYYIYEIRDTFWFLIWVFPFFINNLSLTIIMFIHTYDQYWSFVHDIYIFKCTLKLKINCDSYPPFHVSILKFIGSVSILIPWSYWQTKSKVMSIYEWTIPQFYFLLPITE